MLPSRGDQPDLVVLAVEEREDVGSVVVEAENVEDTEKDLPAVAMDAVAVREVVEVVVVVGDPGELLEEFLGECVVDVVVVRARDPLLHSNSKQQLTDSLKIVVMLV